MDTIRHHLTDEVLMGYAAGALPEAFALVVATHVSLCDACRAAAASCDALGGSVLETVAPVAMSEGSFEATVARIARGGDGRRAPCPATGAFPAPLRAYAGDGPEAVRWRSLGGGVRQARLATSGAASARLFRIPAGMAMPDHGHRGTEMTLVLQGAFSDGAEHFARGDVELAGTEVRHTPVAAPGQDCICLAATDAALRFTSLLPRLVQPFLRI